MIEDLLPWWLAFVSAVMLALVSYFIGNWRAKNDMKLERRTLIFEDILRTTSNLVDKTIVEKSIKTGMIEIKKSGTNLLFDDLDEDDTIIGLIGSDWHTHGDLLTYYGGESEPEAICLFVTGIFSGEYFLVEERKAGKVTRKYIEDDRESVFKYLEPDEEVIIYNDR